MKVKNVVKVMNFHSLLRVDKARKEAEKYFAVENQLRIMIDSISNNRNIILDKKILQIDQDKPALNIYIGSDLGFCGAYNFLCNNALKDDNSQIIVIGKKVRKNKDNIIYSMTKEEYTLNPDDVTKIIQDGIKKGDYSEINVLYNNYENLSNISWIKKRIYPFEFDKDSNNSYTEDYVSETDIKDLLIEMICTYVDYDLRITVKNSFASENVMRQNSTNESLKKIDELEEQQAQAERKQKSIVASAKNVERYVKRRFGKVSNDAC